MNPLMNNRNSYSVGSREAVRCRVASKSAPNSTSSSAASRSSQNDNGRTRNNNQILMHFENRKSGETSSSQARSQKDDSSSENENQEDALSYWLWRGSILLCAICWAGNFPFTKILENIDASPAALCATRFGVAGLLMTPAFLQVKERASVAKGAAIGVLLAIGYVGQAIGLGMGVGSGKSAFICSLQVVFVSVICAFRAGRISRATLASTALALSGAAFLELGGVLEGGSLSVGVADAYLLLQPLCFGLSYLWIEEAMEEHPNDALPSAAAQVLACGLTCGIYAIGENALRDGVGLASATKGLADVFGAVYANDESMQALLYLALIGTSSTIALEVMALSKVPPRDVSVLLSTEPLFAALWAFILLDESLTSSECVGGVLVVAACVANEVLGEQQPSADA
ncbi:EamA domain-containing protein [Pseudoscourfieldia marina]